MDFCFLLPKSRLKDPSGYGSKYLLPFKQEYMEMDDKNLERIMKYNEKYSNQGNFIISYDSLLKDFLWQLPSQSYICSKNHNISLSIALPDLNKVEIKFNNENCMMKYMSKKGESINNDYLYKVQKGNYFIFIFKKRVTNPRFEAENPNQFLPIKHPFRVLGKKLYYKIDDQPLLEFILHHSYSSKGYENKINSLKKEINEEFLENLRGFSKVYITDNDDFPISYGDSRIHSLFYLDVYYKDIINKCQFIEIDATFKIFQPYVVSIPMGIIDNESFPLGIAIGPSESKELFDRFYCYIKEIDEESFAMLKTKPILSDEGSSLKAFAKANELLQYFCFRHYIEKLGSNTPLGKIAQKILFIEKHEEYIQYWNENQEEIKQALQLSTDKSKEKFFKIFEVTQNDQELISSFSTQSLWERKIKQIATCSNHVESCHQKLNAGSAFIHKNSFARLFYVMINYIEERIIKASKRPNLQYFLRENKSKVLDLSSYKCILYNIRNSETPNANITLQITKINYEKITIIKDSSDWIFHKFDDYIGILTDYDRGFLIASGEPDISVVYNFIKNIFFIEEENKKSIKNIFIHFSAKVFASYHYETCYLHAFASYCLQMITKKFKDAGLLISFYAEKFKNIRENKQIYTYKSENSGLDADYTFDVYTDFKTLHVTPYLIKDNNSEDTIKQKAGELNSQTNDHENDLNKSRILLKPLLNDRISQLLETDE